MNRSFVAGILVFSSIALTVGLANADPVRDGNELALKFSGAAPAARKLLQNDRTDTIHVFRYLKVTAVQTNAPSEGLFTLMTVEPSSDMKVELLVSPSARLSLQMASTLATNECVAAQGRIKSLGTEKPDLMVIEQAVLLHKDRAQPKAGAELMEEFDPRAVK